MTPERWLQLKQIFQSALERNPAERSAFLSQACADDPALRSEVESLISSHDQAGDSIEAMAAGAATEMLEDDRAIVGKQIGHYEVLRRIGRGGMGEVFLAQDTNLGRKVALKLLRSDFTRNEERLRRFRQEARAASGLNHPNILTIHEIGQDDTLHFMATEYVEGETLRENISHARMTVGQALDVAVQVASALAAAHQAGIIHRDIKPENIMRRTDGYVKVLDFGLAKLGEPKVIDTAAPTLPKVETEPGLVMGTVAYMSPEQARGMTVDARTDIFSLGVVMYEMVAGCLPFVGSTSSEVMAAILNEKEPPPLARYAREVPAEFERIVEKALRKDREERYQVIKDMLLDLKQLKQRLQVEAELERSKPPEVREVTAETKPSSLEVVSTAQASAAQTAAVERARTASSAEYIISEIKQHRRGALLVLGVLLAATVAVAYFVYSRYFAESGKVSIDSETSIRSIAVLPFANTSNNPDTEYLSDGITESLINSLSQLPGMKVIARSSSFKYKGKEVDPLEVGHSLGVAGVVTGRVAQRGENLIISVEMVDARDKTQVWGEQYNRKATDLLQMQSEISEEIARKLRLRLTASEQKQLARRETVNPQAYELLLKGRFYRNKSGTENQKKAVEFFNQAIAVDPNYALAYVELSERYAALVSVSILDPKEFTPKAEAAAHKALELDESLAEAHRSLAIMKLVAWDWAAAEREFKRAIELNPNVSRQNEWYAHYLSIMGRHDEAIAEAKRARELDPLSLAMNFGVSYRLFHARRYDQAIEAAKKTLELHQNSPALHVILGFAYAAKDQYPEAIAAYQEAVRLGDRSPDTQIYLGAAYAKAGEREKARAILKRLETGKGYVAPGALAALYVALGEREQAFASLERAYAEHDAQLQFLGIDWNFDPLRSDPRFQELLKKVGF